jgi:prepilin-type N-terminal cleavage/methylation domain-containing protein
VFALLKSNLSNKNGFGIIEVLVCMVLVGFLSLAIANMMTSANNANRNIIMTLESASTTSLLGVLLSDRGFCDYNFTVNNIVEMKLDNNLKDLVIPLKKISYPVVAGAPPPEVLFDSSSLKTQGNSIQITGMSLSNIKTFNSALQIAKLNISYDKGPGTQGPRVVSRNLYLRLETVVTTAPTVKVLHCNSIGFGAIPQDASPGTPDSGQEIDDKLFQNLIAGLKALSSDVERLPYVISMITNWQNLGLVSKGKYMTIAKFSSLFKDGGIYWAEMDSSDLCKFFSGKIIDPANATLVTSFLGAGDDSRCPPLLSK